MSVCPKCDDDKFYDLHCSRCGFDTAELLVTERDAARAEVERLTEELARWRKSFAGHVYVKTEDYSALVERAHAAEAEAEAERLREALRDLEEACRDVASWSEECVDYSHPARVKARAALAGAPSETRREQDRALAERVREACAKHLLIAPRAGGELIHIDHSRLLALIANDLRALDLDALLEEP